MLPAVFARDRMAILFVNPLHTRDFQKIGRAIDHDGRPVELDEHRGMAAQKLTEIRRRLNKVQADQAALRRRQRSAR